MINLTLRIQDAEALHKELVARLPQGLTYAENILMNKLRIALKEAQP